MEININKSLITVMVGDITKLEIDAIVNAANSSLLGGGGVDGAIHRAAGPELLSECRKIGGCPPGEARITKGYNLHAEWIVHTVGPVYNDGRHGEAKILGNAYHSSLIEADKKGIKSVAFPAISTGVYNYPLKEAAKISLATIIDFLKTDTSITDVIIVLFKEDFYNIYKEVYQKYYK